MNINGGIKKLFLLGLSLFSLNLICMEGEQLQNDWHFDTKFLSKTKEVRKRLLEEGREEDRFEAVDFKSIKDQNIKLKGLFRKRANARYTIIFTPGFFCGHKEGFAPFAKLAPTDCNLLFTELRNRGESSGNGLLAPLTTAGGYGVHEPEDLAGAILYAAEKTDGKPIILFGWCSGALITVRTLEKLRELSREHNLDFIRGLNIQGFIFDSGFGSLKDFFPNGSVAPGIHTYKDNQYIAKKTDAFSKMSIPGFFIDGASKLIAETSSLIAQIPNLEGAELKEQAVKNAILAGIYGISATTTDAALFILGKRVGPKITANDPITNIYDNIALISDIKGFLIHSKEDVLAPFDNVKRLATNITKHRFWETEGDSHVRNHIKYKEEYKQRLASWLNDTVVTNPPVMEDIEPHHYLEMISRIDKMTELLDTTDTNVNDEIENALTEMSTLKEKFAQEFSELEEFSEPFENIKNTITQNVDRQQVKENLKKMRKILNKEVLKIIKNILKSATWVPQNKKQPQEQDQKNVENADRAYLIKLLNKAIKLLSTVNDENFQINLQKAQATIDQFTAAYPNAKITKKEKVALNKKIKELQELQIKSNAKIQELQTANKKEEGEKIFIESIEKTIEILIEMRNILDPENPVKNSNKIKNENPQDAKGKPNQNVHFPNYSSGKGKGSGKNKGEQKKPTPGYNHKPKSDNSRSSSLSNARPGSGYSPSSGSSGYPSYNDYPSNSPYGGGYPYFGDEGGNMFDDMPWNPGGSSANNKQKDEKPTGVTKYDIDLLDATYDDPELKDLPERRSRRNINWNRMFRGF
ncbi:hypothetical protein ACFLYA_00410 [Candidatus Dependentiae bacterium]